MNPDTQTPPTRGLLSEWKDGKHHKQIKFGYCGSQNLFVIEAQIGRRNPKKTTMALSPTATLALFEMMTKVIFPNQK
jgi:hypothetical protein